MHCTVPWLHVLSSTYLCIAMVELGKKGSFYCVSSLCSKRELVVGRSVLLEGTISSSGVASIGGGGYTTGIDLRPKR